MKLREATHSIESQGVIQEKEFGFKLGPQVMDILSSLYSNPIEAIVREYWTNGEDGHVALRRQGGTPPKEIEVHVPNTNECWFSVRDYGVGMDHETAWEVFTLYGASTKNDNNDETGGLGLGAKSGYAYTGGSDQWTVTTYHDGTKRIYVAAKNAKGMPTFALFQELETSEPNGVEVRIPVALDDRHLFKGAIAKFAVHAREEFVIQGDFEGVQNGHYVRETYQYANKFYGKSPKKTETPAVRMGSVLYPLDPHLAGLEDADKYRVQDKVLFLEVGSLEISPDRESLKYSDFTKKGIEAHLAKMVTEDMKALEKIEILENFGEHYTLLTSIFGNYFNEKSVETVVKNASPKYAKKFEAFWKDKVNLYQAQVSLSDLAPEKADKDQLEDWQYRRYWFDESNLRVSQDKVNPLDMLPVTADRGAEIFIADIPRGISTIKKALRRGLISLRHGTVFYILSPDKGKKDYDRADAIEKLLRGIPATRASEILAKNPDLHTRKSGSGNSGGRSPASVFKWYTNSSGHGGWAEQEVDLNDGGYYVTFAYRKWMDTRMSKYRLTFSQIIDILSTFGDYDGEPIYGIPKSRLKEVKGNEDWVDFEDEIEADLKHILETEELKLQRTSLNQLAHDGKYSELSRAINALTFRPYLGKAPELPNELCKDLTEAHEAIRKEASSNTWETDGPRYRAVTAISGYRNWASGLADKADIQWENGESLQALADAWDALIEKYTFLIPLVKGLGYYSANKNFQELLFHFMDQVDELEELRAKVGAEDSDNNTTNTQDEEE